MTDLLLYPKTVWMPASIDACALYRMFIPHLKVTDSLFLYREKLSLEHIANYKITVVQRQVTPENYKALQVLRGNGKKVVYDLDDNMWALPSTNPAQKIFKMMAEGFSYCAKEAHVLTVSTAVLKSAVKSAMPFLKCEILVVPNSMDFSLFRQSPLQHEDERVIVGWAGSNTHSGDLREIHGVLPKLLEVHKNLYVQFVGMVPEDGTHKCPRVECRDWVPVAEFPNRFPHWSWDIAIAPLEDIRFNRSKSNIKMLEAAAIRIPCLVSDVQPYREFCALGGKELEWLLCRFDSDWSRKLERLINDSDYRKYLGELMYATAKKYFDSSVIRNNWLHALETAARS